MGTGQSFECCKSFPDEGQYNLKLMEGEDSYSKELPSSDYSFLSSQVRKVNLLSAINFAVEQVTSQQQHLIDINCSFNLISKFIQILEFSCSHSFLSVLHSKTYLYQQKQPPGRKYNVELCLLDVPVFEKEAKRDSSHFSKQLKLCFKLLDLLKLDHPLNQFEPKALFESLVEELTSIPHSESCFWDIEQGEELERVTFHLRYNLGRYFNFLNSYLSVNDPTSYTHVRSLYHMVDQHFCNTSLSFRTQRYVCSLNSSQCESWLYKKKGILISTNFIPFASESQVSQEDQWQEGKSRDQSRGDKALRLVLFPTQAKLPKKFIDNGILYYLPFTMFLIQRVNRRQRSVDVYLQQVEEQTLHHEIKKTFRGEDKEEHTNHVLINESNIVSQLNSLKEALVDQLSAAASEVNDRCSKLSQESSTLKEGSSISQAESLFIQYYQKYLSNAEVSESREKGGQADRIVSEKDQAGDRQNEGVAEEDNYQEDEQGPCHLIEPPQQQVYRLEEQLSQYVRRTGLEKLQHQLFTVDRFIDLQYLNLSQCWLQRMEALGCFPNLLQLYLYSNQIQKIEGLKGCGQLKVLSLARNKIKRLEHMENLLSLRYLFVTKNLLGKESADYLTTLKVKRLNSLSISFAEGRDASFQVIAHKIPFKVKSLRINEASLISSRTKNMLQKRLKGTSVIFFNT